MNETSTGSAATGRLDGNAVAPDDLDVRLGMVKALSQDAARWRRSGERRQAWLFAFGAILVIAVFAVVGLSLWLYSNSLSLDSRNKSLDELKEQLTLALDAAQGLYAFPPREAKHDRKMATVLTKAEDWARQDKDKVRGPEARGHLRETIGSIDVGLRSWLSDVLIERFPDTASFGSRFQNAVVESARCDIAGASQEKTNLMNDAGIGFAPVEDLHEDATSPAIKKIRPREMWFPARREEGTCKRAAGEDYVTQASAGSVICMSDDASWLMVWDPNPATIKVIMRRFVWNRPEKGLAEPESLGLSVREVRTVNSLGERRYLEWREGIDPERLRSLQIKWFQLGPYVGFLVPAKLEGSGDIKLEGSVAIWTTTGLEDPEEMKPGHASRIHPECKYALSDSERKIYTCDLDKVKLGDMGEHRLVIEYQSDPSGPSARCDRQSVACESTIKVEYELDGKNCNVAVLAPFSARILRAHIVGEGLYFLTATGQVFRYTVALSTFKSLLDNRVIDMK